LSHVPPLPENRSSDLYLITEASRGKLKFSQKVKL
jgi:hypothetical protein